MHRHFCDAEGHDWQCSGDCECICGLPMEGHDHSECPVELRACPEHAAEFQRRMAQPCSPEAEAEAPKRLREQWEARPRCECVRQQPSRRGDRLVPALRPYVRRLQPGN